MRIFHEQVEIGIGHFLSPVAILRRCNFVKVNHDVEHPLELLISQVVVGVLEVEVVEVNEQIPYDLVVHESEHARCPEHI